MQKKTLLATLSIIFAVVASALLINIIQERWKSFINTLITQYNMPTYIDLVVVGIIFLIAIGLALYRIKESPTPKTLRGI